MSGRRRRFVRALRRHERTVRRAARERREHPLMLVRGVSSADRESFLAELAKVSAGGVAVLPRGVMLEVMRASARRALVRRFKREARKRYNDLAGYVRLPETTENR